MSRLSWFFLVVSTLSFFAAPALAADSCEVEEPVVVDMPVTLTTATPARPGSTSFETRASVLDLSPYQLANRRARIGGTAMALSVPLLAFGSLLEIQDSGSIMGLQNGTGVPLIFVGAATMPVGGLISSSAAVRKANILRANGVHISNAVPTMARGLLIGAPVAAAIWGFTEFGTVGALMAPVFVGLPVGLGGSSLLYAAWNPTLNRRALESGVHNPSHYRRKELHIALAPVIRDRHTKGVSLVGRF